MVFLGESSGARMPDHMGSRGMGMLLGNDGTQYQRMRETPWASATLGLSYGSSSWYAVLSEFNVMRKGAVMAVASPNVTSLAIGKPMDPEELGGWKLLTGVSGLADLAVDTDQQALDDYLIQAGVEGAVLRLGTCPACIGLRLGRALTRAPCRLARCRLSRPRGSRPRRWYCPGRRHQRPRQRPAGRRQRHRASRRPRPAA